MFSYYLALSLKSLLRSKVTAALIVATLGLGVGSAMVMLTVVRVLTGDPVPSRAGSLFYVQVDPRPKGGYYDGVEPPSQLTWADAEGLLAAHRAPRQAAMTGGQLTLDGTDTRQIAARYTTRDFFEMFDLQMLEGSFWSAEDDTNGAQVVVVTRTFARTRLHNEHPVGSMIRLGSHSFRVVGVMEDWNPVPHFYDLNQNGAYAKGEQLILPLRTAHDLELPKQGGMNCWTAPSGAKLSEDNCVWLQFWVQLPTTKDQENYLAFLKHYASDQRQLGRFERPPNVRLSVLSQWLDSQGVFPRAVALQSYLAMAFLGICLINSIALILVTYLRRGSELAIRRAMGATRRSILSQLVMESMSYGLVSGALGLAVLALGLFVVREQPTPYAYLAHADVGSVLLTVLTGILSALFAALFPAWYACRKAPAHVLKIQ